MFSFFVLITPMLRRISSFRIIDLVLLAVDRLGPGTSIIHYPTPVGSLSLVQSQTQILQVQHISMPAILPTLLPPTIVHTHNLLINTHPKLSPPLNNLPPIPQITLPYPLPSPFFTLTYPAAQRISTVKADKLRKLSRREIAAAI